MPVCEVCGNDYDKAFEVRVQGATHVFDSFECAIHALAPTCAHCGWSGTAWREATASSAAFIALARREWLSFAIGRSSARTSAFHAEAGAGSCECGERSSRRQLRAGGATSSRSRASLPNAL
jgi:hypothetical protein